MKIGIMADSHDNLPQIKKACAIFIKEKVSYLIHAGDVIAPFAAEELRKSRIKIVAVFGNNDGEKSGLKNVLVNITEPPYQVEIAGRQIILVHSLDQLPEDLSQINIVIFGHTHKPQITNRGPSLFINPGECGGWLSNQANIALLDLPDGEANLEASRVRHIPL